ncbi:hypothetical protein QJS10_CPA01g01588 [Acorus calamus]|uniref:TRF2/HOY1 PH-like domain-containing protein n=1 Tax=Acorus calamus TaxID=4465 RepID=A0AAV9FMU1_ACOCL|nr:hypothetical protein QJS10_CPA01g01588 [Acorus calamus]
MDSNSMASYNVSHVHGDGDSSGQASASRNQLPECTTSKVDFSKEKLLGEAKNSNPKRKRKVEDSSTEATEGKPKASHIPVRLLRIGSWERTSQYGEGLMAKFYYGKSLLNWDMLEDTGLMNRIEIRWSDITAIRATFTKNEHDILEIEVKTVPRFLKEKTNVGMTSISKSSTAPSASMTSEVTSASSNEVNNKKARLIQSKTTLQQYVPLDVGDITMSNSDGWVLAQEPNEPLMPSDLLDFGSRCLNGPDEVFSDIDETDLGWNF